MGTIQFSPRNSKEQRTIPSQPSHRVVPQRESHLQSKGSGDGGEDTGGGVESGGTGGDGDLAAGGLDAASAGGRGGGRAVSGRASLGGRAGGRGSGAARASLGGGSAAGRGSGGAAGGGAAAGGGRTAVAGVGAVLVRVLSLTEDGGQLASELLGDGASVLGNLLDDGVNEVLGVLGDGGNLVLDSLALAGLLDLGLAGSKRVGEGSAGLGEAVDGVAKLDGVASSQIGATLDLGLARLEVGDELVSGLDKVGLVALVGISSGLDAVKIGLDSGDDTLDNGSVTGDNASHGSRGEGESNSELHVDGLLEDWVLK